VCKLISIALIASTVAWIGILAVPGSALAIPGSGGDNFDDGIVDPAKWGPSITDGSGVMAETNGRLEFSVPSAPTSFDQVYYYWQGSSPTFGASWGMWVDLHNETNPNQIDQVNGFGLFAENENDPGDYIYSEMYSSQLGQAPVRRGFYTEAVTNGASHGFGDSGSLYMGGGPDLITDGSLQILYNADTGRINSYYSLTGGNLNDWTLFSSFGVANAAAGDPAEDWNMGASDHFKLGIYGYGYNEIVVSTEVYGDNFTMLNSPEPGTAILLGLGLVGITVLRRQG